MHYGDPHYFGLARYFFTPRSKDHSGRETRALGVSGFDRSVQGGTLSTCYRVIRNGKNNFIIRNGMATALFLW